MQALQRMRHLHHLRTVQRGAELHPVACGRLRDGRWAGEDEGGDLQRRPHKVTVLQRVLCLMQDGLCLRRVSFL